MEALGFRGRRRTFLVVLVALALVVPLGYAVGVGLKVSKGPGEKALGTNVAVGTVGTWWGFDRVGSVLAAGGLTSVSTTPGTPSPVAANASTAYGLGTVNASATALEWIFLVTTSTPASTELELTFTVSLAGSPSTVKAYIETPATSVAATQQVSFYLAEGTVTLAALTIQSLVESSQVCTSVGVCP